MRRYGRYQVRAGEARRVREGPRMWALMLTHQFVLQGYAWAAVGGTGLIALALSRVTPSVTPADNGASETQQREGHAK